MFGKNCSELLVPALLGLGMFAQSTDTCLANNTSILLLLGLVLSDKNNHHDEHHDHNRYLPYGRYGYFRAHHDDGVGGCGCFDPCDPCGHERRRHRFERNVERELRDIRRCTCNHHRDRDRDEREHVAFV